MHSGSSVLGMVSRRGHSCGCCEQVKSRNPSQAVVSITKGSTETHTLPRFPSDESMVANARMSKSHSSNFVSDGTPAPGSSDSGDFPAVHQR